MVAQHHAERHPARSHRIEQAAPHAFGRGPRHHIAREDDQIGTFRRQNAVQAGKGLFGLGKPPGFGGVEVHIRELRYLESFVAAEAQHRLLRPDGGGETAEALDIDEEFGLVVRRPDGAVKTVRSGEVSVRGLYGYTE